MGILDAIAGAKGKGSSGEDEATASDAAPKTGYRMLIKEAAEDGDWDAFADAVVGLCKQSYGK